MRITIRLDGKQLVLSSIRTNRYVLESSGPVDARPPDIQKSYPRIAR